MAERPRNEKEEKGRGEKEEKGRHNRADTLIWAAVLIWAGLVLLADTTGFGHDFNWWNTWAVIFVGAGAIVLLAAIIRLLIPEQRWGITGSLIMGFILIGVGLGGLVGWGLVWPIVLIAIGLIIVLRNLFRRR
ncbi:MAG: hypothetical protein PHU08_07945 [Dehalococcoidales bacterium]|nr:hypothetical protein [Dehalococcoidales bacterium]